MRLLSKKAYLVLLLGDIGILYISVWIALAMRYFKIPNAETFIIHIVPFSLFFIFWFCVFFVIGLYGKYTALFLKKLPQTIFKAQLFNITLIALFFYLFPVFVISPKWLLFIYAIVSTVFLYIWRVHMFPHLPLRNEIGALLIGTSSELSQLAETVNRDSLYPLEFRAIVHPELVEPDSLRSTILRLVSSGEIRSIVTDMGNHALDTILPFIYNITFIQNKAHFIDVRSLFEEVFERVPLSLISDRWVLNHVSLSPHTLYSLSKRLLDIVFSFIFGVLTLPLYPFIIAAMKTEGCKKVFIKENYIGKNNKKIALTSFCTINPYKQTLSQASLILQKTGLYKLPHLWNIFIGELSFVGPTPHTIEQTEQYSKEIKYYNIRHLTRPGIISWGRAKHYNHSKYESVSKDTPLMLSYDLYYIKERSLWMDIITIAKSFFIVFR